MHTFFWNRYYILAVNIVTLLSGRINAQVCPAVIGPDTTLTGLGDNTNNQDVNFLMISDGVVNCFGVLENWEMRTRNGGNQCRQTVNFQVWRPDPNSNFGYTLIGENVIDLDSRDIPDCTAARVSRWDIPDQYRIPVQSGDIIGWSDDGGNDRPMRFRTAPAGSTLIARNPWSCSVGSTCSWLPSDPSIVQDARVFLLRPTSNQGEPPYFTNLPETVTINANEPAGYLLYTVKASFEHNAQTVVIPRMTYIITGGPCQAFCTIDGFTGEITVAVTITGNACSLNIRALPEGYPNIAAYTVDGTLTVNVRTTFGPGLNLDDPPNSREVDTGDPGVAQNEEILQLATSCIGDCAGLPERCDIVTSDPSFPPFEIPNPTANTPRVRLNFGNLEDLEDWQGPETYNAGIACSHTFAITRRENLTVTFTNLRQAPTSDLPSSVIIPETQRVTDGAFHRVDDIPVPGDQRSNSITFDIVYTFPHSATGWFRVDNAGDIFITGNGEGNLDFFVQDSYELTIEITDQGAPHKSEPKNLTVEISWINQPPTLGPLGTAGYTSRIPEHTPIGTALPDVTLDATDRDIQGGDWITYTLVDQGTPPLGAFMFTVSNVTSKVYVDDVMAVPPGVPSITYNLNIHVFDSYGETVTGPPVVSSLSVEVYDINDHAPVFDPSYYTGRVSESDIGPTLVTTVTATDDDAGDNAIIIYFIVETEAKLYFEIGASSGIISLIQPIRYVDHPNITFTVMATDLGTPPSSGTATVFIEVDEVNNHEPVFDPKYYSVETRSDLPIGETVVQVTAIDLDSSDVNSLAYYFVVDQDDFDIMHQVGNITVAQHMRSWKKYVLYVNADDNGIPSLHSDPAYIRIDTFDASSTLFDIYLNLPLESFLTKQDSFKYELNHLLSPWTVVIEKVLLNRDLTVVTCYAMSSYLPKTDLLSPKIFVSRNDAMQRLRVRMEGDPNEDIREPPFAEFEPIRVVATYPDWFIDTPGGIATLVTLCLLLALAIPLCILLCKKVKWLCFKPKISVVEPQPFHQQPNDGFKLNYGQTPVKKGIYAGPLVPQSLPMTEDLSESGKPNSDESRVTSTTPILRSRAT